MAAGILSVVQPRWYESTASVEVLGLNENFLNTRDVYPTAAPGTDSTAVYVQTQADLLGQDTLLALVANDLRLDEREEFSASPAFWRRLFEPRPASERQTVRDTVEELQKHLKIIPSRNSRLIQIVAEAHDPNLAADIANRLAQRFMESRTEERSRSVKQVYESLNKQVAQLEASLNRSALAVPLRSKSAGFFEPGSAALRPEIEAKRKFLEAMQQRVNEAAIAAAVPQPTVRIIGRALPAPYPYRPNLPLNLAIGLFGGLLLGIGWVMLQEQTSSVVRSPGEAGMLLAVPELGAIPRVKEPGLGAAYAFGLVRQDQRPESSALEWQGSRLAESFRATLASILATNQQEDARHSFVVTSSSSMEGKTTVVSNLGIALAEISEKVLLIDGDLRRPRLHRVFDQANSWGLTDVLREKNAIESLPPEALVKKTTVPHLYLLPSGPCTDNIFGLLHSGRMAWLVPRLQEEFEYVLIDAPPCLEFVDARIMARHAKQLLLVMRADSTARRTAQRAVHRLLLDGISVRGVILNSWAPENKEPYYSFDDDPRGLS